MIVRIEGDALLLSEHAAACVKQGRPLSLRLETSATSTHLSAKFGEQMWTHPYDVELIQS